MKLTHIDLFSGIGGFALAAQWAGFETIVFCENDEYCQEVIQKRFGGYVADSGRIEHDDLKPWETLLSRKSLMSLSKE